MLVVTYSGMAQIEESRRRFVGLLGRCVLSLIGGWALQFRVLYEEHHAGPLHLNAMVRGLAVGVDSIGSLLDEL